MLIVVQIYIKDQVVTEVAALVVGVVKVVLEDILAVEMVTTVVQSMVEVVDLLLTLLL